MSSRALKRPQHTELFPALTRRLARVARAWFLVSKERAG
jgi:hypothetical protein